MLLNALLSALWGFVLLLGCSSLVEASATNAKAINEISTNGPTARNAATLVKINSLPEGYTLGGVIFNGRVGNVEGVKVEGMDVADIIDQVRAAHAGFEYNLEEEKSLYNASVFTSTAADIDLKRRNKSNLDCFHAAGVMLMNADIEYVHEDIAYLYSLHGRCGVQSHQCIRISCHAYAAIFICNDNEYFIEPDCGYLASYADDIVRTCQRPHWYDGRLFVEVAGREFDTDHYNVVVAYQSCHRPANTMPGF